MAKSLDELRAELMKPDHMTMQELDDHWIAARDIAARDYSDLENRIMNRFMNDPDPDDQTQAIREEAVARFAKAMDIPQVTLDQKAARVEKDPLTYVCNLCGYTNYSASVFAGHMRGSHPEVADDQFPEVKAARGGIKWGGVQTGRQAGKSMAFGNVNTSSEQKPMVTREDYDKARAVLDALPPGYYVKCGGCGGWFNGGNFVLDASGTGPKCERCAH